MNKSKGKNGIAPRGNLWRLSVRAKDRDEEAVRGELFAVTGAYPAVHSRPRSKTVRIECFLKNPARARAACRQLAHLRPRLAPLPYEDWAESWKKHFGIQRIGKHIVIKPSWKTHRPRTDDIVIELDPGMNFGTGQHETTRFCLRMIERLCGHRRFSLLDVGTGSGILAIAASKLGFSPVLAIDNDPQAVLVTGANALANGARLRVRRLALDEMRTDFRYDVVVANILADVLIAQRDRLVALLNPCGYLVLAGILANEANQVSRAFRPLGLKPFACETARNWAGFAFRKPKGRDHEKAACDR